jgi:hypothetical protein
MKNGESQKEWVFESGFWTSYSKAGIGCNALVYKVIGPNLVELVKCFAAMPFNGLSALDIAVQKSADFVKSQISKA